MTPLSNTTERVVVELPWPARELHPNARVHWAVKAKHTKMARMAAAWSAKAVGAHKLPVGKLDLTLVFHCPDARRRDSDGLLSSMKAAIDGIADATGIDDSNFNLTIRRGDIIRDGRVRIEIEAITP